MSQPILFFRKSLMDIDTANITITITDAVATNTGQDFVSYMRNRKNDSAWITTGSTDAANTTIVVDFVDEVAMTDILIIDHNLGDYTIQYWDGANYQDFSTTIAEVSNTETTNHHNFASVSSSKIQIIITGAQVADADKYIKQLIVTRKIVTGQLTGWPTIKKPVVSTSKKASKMLSGKINLIESIESFSVNLDVKNWNIDADLNIIEDIYFRHQGILIWLCGGDEDQFSTNRIGYKKENIFLVRPVNEWTPELYKGVYSTGVKVSLKLVESVS